jgi:uncharacterized protein (TIGR02679 family)
MEVRTVQEADALQDLIGRWVEPGKKVGLRLIDELLREKTIFHCSMAEAVVLHREEPIRRPKEEKARLAVARERAVARCFQLLPELRLSPNAYARVVSWMEANKNDLLAGFRKWKEEGILAAVRAVALAFHRMPDEGSEPVFLADLSNEVAGDDHGLDADRPAGKLLFRALAFHYPDTAKLETRWSAAWKTNLLSEARIARDPISVRVDTFGLMGDSPYLQELRRAGLTRSVNLDDLARIGNQVQAWRGVVFVVENPTVFAALVKHVRKLYVVESHPTLVCTNGIMNEADWKLLRAFSAAGAHIFYSGDFDVRGLQIARRVMTRFPEHSSPWRMSSVDYLAAIRGERSNLDTHALDCEKPFFPDLVAQMTTRGQRAHHEGLIASFTADLDAFITRGVTPPRRGDAPGSAAQAQRIPSG